MVAAVASGLSDDAILEITQAALSENRIDLYLQPVVSPAAAQGEVLRDLFAAARW